MNTTPPQATEILALSAVEMAAKVRAGELSAQDTVAASFARIAELDFRVHAFRHLWREDARARARAIDSSATRSQLPLAGVPFALKENTSRTHPLIRILEAAGAIAVGTTYNPQFCAWGSTTEAGNMVENPVLPGRTPGGSSGRAAAAVAAGMVTFAQGSDGMGSLRIPAACCRLTTLKTTTGTLPGGVSGTDWFGMTVLGVITRTTAELSLILEVLTQSQLGSRAAAEHTGQTGTKTLTPQRVMVDLGAPIPGVRPSAAYAAAARTAAGRIAATAATPTETSVPYPRNPLPVFARWTAGVAEQCDLDAPPQVEWRNRVHVRIGRLLRRTISPQQVRRHRAEMAKKFPLDSVLITPALAQDPPRNQQWHRQSWLANIISNVRYTPYASAFNYLDYPAGVVIEPTTGLPVQVIAREGRDDLVLAAMAAIEAPGV